MTEKAKILFVDDERQILISLRALFRSKYKVFIANDGKEALNIIGRERIHAIISDQRMPKMSGTELLREVNKVSPSTMRLLLTGYSDLKSIMDSINEGEVFRFINKPWDNTAIHATVDSAVQIALATEQSDADDITDTEAHATPSPPRAQNPANAAATNDTPLLEDTVIPSQTAGILIIDDSTETRAKVKELFGKTYPIYSASSINDAMAILGDAEIAVIISDITIGGEDTTDFIKTLKHLHPLIMTIVMTDSLDSSMAIDLINHGQIFRYLRKSVGPRMLEISVNNGIRFYQLHKNKPNLLQRYKVEVLNKLLRSPLIGKLKGQLKALRSRFSFGMPL